MDPSGNPVEQLNQSFNQLAPYVHDFTIPNAPALAKQQIAAPSSTASSVLGHLGNWLSQVGHETANIVTHIPSFIGTQYHNSVNGIENFGKTLQSLNLANYTTKMNQQQNNSLDQWQNSVMDAFRTGKMDKQTYIKELNAISNERTSVVKSTAGVSASMPQIGNDLFKYGTQTAATVVTLMSMGGLTLGSEAVQAELGTQMAAKYMMEQAPNHLLDSVINTLDNAAQSETFFNTLPTSLKSVVAKSITETAAKAMPDLTAAQIARATATKVLLDYPLTFNAMSGTGTQLYDELQKGKYGDAVKTLAFNAAMLLSGGPFTKALDLLKGGAAATGKAMFGQKAFIDEVSKLIGDGSPNAMYNFLHNELAKGNKDLVKQVIAWADTNMQAENGNAVRAANRAISFLRDYANWGNMTNHTVEEVLNNASGWAQAHEILNAEKLAGRIKGIAANDPRIMAVGRWTIKDNSEAAQAILDAHNAIPLGATSEERIQALTKAWEDFKASKPNSAIANNDNLDRQIKGLIEKISDPKRLNKAIKSIDAQKGVAGLSSIAGKKIAKLGYVPIIPKNVEAPFVSFEKGTGKLVSNFASKEEPGFFSQATQPVPVLGEIGKLLTNAGLSPQAASTRVQDIFNSNFIDNLQKIEGITIPKGKDAQTFGEQTLKQLSDYMRNPSGGLHIGSFRPRVPINDLRQLTLNDIAIALNTDRGTARQISNALKNSMLQTPWVVRGLGDKIVDAAYRVNPLMKDYMRVQSAARYTWNPFFKARLSTKVEILSEMQGGGTLRAIIGNDFGRIQPTTKLLADGGFFGHGIANEGADEFAAGVGHVGDHLTSAAKQSISALVNTMADKMGMDIKTFIDAHPQQVRDTIQTIVGYNPKAGFLNSPMMRFLNFAYFPARFNLKVGTLMAEALARQDPITQFTVLKGIMNGANYLKTPEGQAWYSQHSDVIGLMKYFTPVETLSSVATTLGQRPHSVMQYGELGGLPFGWIPQLLDSQGLTHFGEPSLNPKTGEVFPKYIPNNDKARLNSAIQSLIGSLYSYPGATIGAPSKTQVDLKVGNFLTTGTTAGNKTDFTKVTPDNLTPEQQQFQQTVQSLNPQPATTPIIRDQQAPPTNITTPQQSIIVPQLKQPKSATSKVKKSQIRPRPVGIY